MAPPCEPSSSDVGVSRRTVIRWMLGAAGAAVASGSVAGAYRYRVERYRVPVANLRRPLLLALLADLHYGPFIRSGSVQAWVSETLSHEPDLVVVDGDLVDEDFGPDTRALLDRLARLRAPLGTYAVWGNHDHTHVRDLPAFGRELASVGIDILVNCGVQVRDDLFLAGIDDFQTGAPDLAAALQGRGAGACVLLSHNPDVLPMVPLDVDLTLCGHTHGGQVCLPFLGPIVTSSAYGRRFAQGWVEGPARGYVSRGLGVSLLPVRFACPAELTLLDMVPA